MARLPPPSAPVAGSSEVAKVAVNDSMDVVVQKLRNVTQVNTKQLIYPWGKSDCRHWCFFQALAVSDSVEQSRNYVALIKDCADAIISLRKAESS